MPSHEVCIRTAPASPRRVAHTRWDRASSTLSCTLTDTGDAASTLRDRLDAALHVAAPQRRVVLGDVDVLLDAEDRPASIEVYTNPARWKAVPSEPAEPADVADVMLEAPWDVNGIASADVPTTIEYDANLHTLTIQFGVEVARWVVFADGARFGVNAQGRLAAIRCERVEMDP